MVRIIVVLALVGTLVAPTAAVAEGPGILSTGNLALLGAPLSDEALGGVRGGFMGLAFSVFFTGFVANPGGDIAGDLTVSTSSPDTANGLTTANFGQGDSAQVRIATISGTAFGGSSGLFHIVQVPGSNNHVVSTVNVEVVLVNVPSAAAVPGVLQALQ